MNIREILEHVQTNPFVARSSDELLQAFATELLLRQGKQLQHISHENKLPNEIIEEILALFPNKKQMMTTYYVHETGECNKTIMFQHEYGLLVQNINEYSDNRAFVSHLNLLLTNDAPSEIFDKILNFLKVEKVFKEPTVDMFLTGASGQIKIEQVPMPPVTWELDNYSPGVIADLEELKEVILTKDHGKGRLSILQGPPGCGKTMFIRALVTELQNSHATFLFAPTSVGLQLTNPSFLSILFNYRTDHPDMKLVLVLEDADLFVENRTGSSQSIAISEFLNATDGIIGATLDLHIIATTNLKKNTFDDAIMRPGRLHMITNFEPLPLNQARKIYRRECNEELEPLSEGNYTLAEIYAKVKKHDNKAKKKLKVNTGAYA